MTGAKFNQMQKTDGDTVRKETPMPVQKAKVVQVPDHPSDDGYHQVYVKLYYDQSQTRATVLAPTQGDVNVPEEGEDVMVLFGAADKPIVLGSFYPTDDKFGEPNEDLVPEYEEGDRIIGNGTGYIRIDKDGSIDASSAITGETTIYDDGDDVGTVGVGTVTVLDDTTYVK